MYCSQNRRNASLDMTKIIKLTKGPLAQGDRLQFMSQEIEYMKNFAISEFCYQQNYQ